jgi:chromosome segregation ATPase
VSQVSEVIQGIEDRAAESLARAHDLAQRAADQLRAMEYRLKEANARLDEAEQMVRQSKAQIAGMGDLLAAAEQSSRSAKVRASDAENFVIQIENEIQCQLLSKLQPSMSEMAAA